MAVTIFVESLGDPPSDNDADTAGPSAPYSDDDNADDADQGDAAADEPNSALDGTGRGSTYASSPTAVDSDEIEVESEEGETESGSSDDGSGEQGSDGDGEEDSGEGEDSEEGEDDNESDAESANDDTSVSSTEDILAQLASGEPVETYITQYRGPRHPRPTLHAGGYSSRGAESAAPSFGSRGRPSSSVRGAIFRAPATRGTGLRGPPRRGGYARGGMSARPVYGSGLGFPSSSSTSLRAPPSSPTLDGEKSIGWPADAPFPADAWQIGKPLQRPDGTWTPPLQFHTPPRGDRSIRRFLRFPPAPALPFPLRSEPSAAATTPRARPSPTVTNSTSSSTAITRPSPIEISSDEDKPAPHSEIDNQNDVPAANTSRLVIDLTASDSDDDANANRALSDSATCPIEIISDSEESVRARRMSTIDLSDGDEDEVRAALQPPAYTTEDEAEHADGSDVELSYASDGEKAEDV
ncbi:hypothetical protein FB107DRAFT_280545 [Schizophyllum commune]